MLKKTSPISIEITVDENKVPEKIIWSAPDGGVDNEVAQAMLLALWDGQNQETLRWICDQGDASRSDENVFSSNTSHHE